MPPRCSEHEEWGMTPINSLPNRPLKEDEVLLMDEFPGVKEAKVRVRCAKHEKLIRRFLMIFDDQVTAVEYCHICEGWLVETGATIDDVARSEKILPGPREPLEA